MTRCDTFKKQLITYVITKKKTTNFKELKVATHSLKFNTQGNFRNSAYQFYLSNLFLDMCLSINSTLKTLTFGGKKQEKNQI